MLNGGERNQQKGKAPIYAVRTPLSSYEPRISLCSTIQRNRIQKSAKDKRQYKYYKSIE
jgi:phage baseplate assembly protein W